MNLPGFLCVIVAAGLVQVSFLAQVKLFGAGPDLFLALTVIAAISYEEPAALAIGLLAGLLKDIFDPGVFGVNTLGFPLAAFLAARLNRSLSLDTPLVCSLITAGAVLLSETVSWTALSYVQASVPRGAFLRIIILEAVFTALIIPPLLSITHPRGRALQ